MMDKSTHAKASEVIGKIKEINDAKFWIDNRNAFSVNTGNYRDLNRAQAKQALESAYKWLKLNGKV